MADDDDAGRFDERMTDSKRVHLRRPRELADAILSALPADEHPEIRSEQDAWIRVAREWLEERSDEPAVVIEGDVNVVVIPEDVEDIQDWLDEFVERE